MSSFSTTAASIIFSIIIGATPGALPTDKAKTVFALQAGGHIVHLSTILIKAVVFVSGGKGGALGKAAIALGYVTFGLQLGAAITESAWT